MNRANSQLRREPSLGSISRRLHLASRPHVDWSAAVLVDILICPRFRGDGVLDSGGVDGV